MNKLYIIIGIIFCALLGGGLWLFVSSLQAPSPIDTSTITTPSPSTNTSGGSVSVSTTPATNIATSGSQTKLIAVQTQPGGQTQGTSVTVKNFINNGITVPDTVNPGQYYLAGSVGYCLADGTCPSAGPARDFIITYSEPDQSFAIILSAEPLGDVRKQAEDTLSQLLGIPKEQMCGLRYRVITPYWVNEIYGGKNLGFSFCPGAVAL